MFEENIKELKEAHEEERARLIQEKDKESSEKSEYERMYDEYKEKYSTLQFEYETEISQLTEEKQALEEKVQILEENIQQIKQQYQEYKESFENKISERLAKEQEKFSQELTQVRAERDKAIQEYKSMTHDEKESFLKHNEKLAEENKQLALRIQEFEIGGNNDHSLKITSLNEELKMVKRRAKEDINDLKKRNQELIDRDKARDSEKEKYEGVIHELRTEVQKVRNVLKKTQSEVEVNTNLKEDSNNIHIKLIDQIKKLEMKVLQQDSVLVKYQEYESERNHEFEEMEQKYEEEKTELRQRLNKEVKRVRDLETAISKQKEEYEKSKNINMANAIEIESKCHKQSRQISELKKEIRKLRTIELEKNMNIYKNQVYNVDQSISLKGAKPLLNLNEKNSETVLYVPQEDTSDASILESLNKQRHKRRPSSVSSVGRIDKTNHMGYNMRNQSPKYDEHSYMGESYISKTFVNDVSQNEIYFQDDHPEKDIEDHTSQSKEMRKITMSYLEEDYEEEHVPRTHRESKNSSRQHYNPETAYKPSPITRSSVSTQNLISRKFTDTRYSCKCMKCDFCYGLKWPLNLGSL